jgi:hypothetical protein
VHFPALQQAVAAVVLTVGLVHLVALAAAVVMAHRRVVLELQDKAVTVGQVMLLKTVLTLAAGAEHQIRH